MTNAELAILSLVAEQPRHGYEIEQIIEARGMREWTEIGFSSIYYLLRKLEKKGWVKVRLEETELGPARKVYTVTTKGHQKLYSELLNILSSPQPKYPAIQLGLANLPMLEPDDIPNALKQYLKQLDEHMEDLRLKQERQSPLPFFVDAMFSYSRAMIQAEAAWIRRFIARYEELEKETHDGQNRF